MAVAPSVEGAEALRALSRLAFSLDPLASCAGLEQALARSGQPPEPLACVIVGDAQAMTLRFEDALRHYLRACEGPALLRLRGAAMSFGRHRAVRAIEAQLPVAERLSREAYRAFLRARALPQIPIGGDAERGFHVDEAGIREIAAELGEPAPALCAETTRAMIAAGSRHAAKLYVLARLSGDEALVHSVAGEFEARAAHLRSALPEAVRRRVPRAFALLQEGTGDGYNPVSAYLFEGEVDGRPVIVKEHLRLRVDPSHPGGYSAEKEILQSISHPHVARLLGSFSSHHHELLVLERARGDDLERLAASAAPFPRADALRIAAQLAQVLAHLHAQGLVYLDIKARNVVWDGRDATLVDFGMARRLAWGERAVSSVLSTPEYVPPEMLRCFSAGRPADVFQLGVLLYRLLVGRHPFVAADFIDAEPHRESQLIKFALAAAWNDADLAAPELDDPGLCALLRRMLARDPGMRPTAAEIDAALAGWR